MNYVGGKGARVSDTKGVALVSALVSHKMFCRNFSSNTVFGVSKRVYLPTTTSVPTGLPSY